MKFNFYDIESLGNVFTLCDFREADDRLDVYYLVDDRNMLPPLDELGPMMAKRIREKNLNFSGSVALFDLHEKKAVETLARTFGLSESRLANDPKQKDAYQNRYRLRADTDPDYDEEKDPYLLGYNSFNYDTTMLAWYFYKALPIQAHYENDPFSDPYPEPVYTTEFNGKLTAREMREFNDRLFSSRFREAMPDALCYEDIKSQVKSYGVPYRIRKNMLLSGRHLDVARLNEKMTKVGLKRLLGMEGRQILESDKLDTGKDMIEDLDQFLDLVAYNASDVINLAELFHTKFYQGQFTLKRQLLRTYDSLVYEKKKDAYEADTSDPCHIMSNRLCIDSSSAQFAARALAPYGPLGDMPAVSFLYPSEEKAKERGVKRVDVLEESKKFFYDLYPVNTPDPARNAKNASVRKKFHEHFYDYYASFRGKNFNRSDNYARYCQGTPLFEALDEREIMPDFDGNMFYFDKNGDPTSGYVKFSIGGIHGAEYNLEYYQAHLDKWQQACDLLAEARRRYPDPMSLLTAKTVTLSDGKAHAAREFLTSSKTKIEVPKWQLVKKPVRPKKTEIQKDPELLEKWQRDVKRWTMVKEAIGKDLAAAHDMALLRLEDGSMICPKDYIIQNGTKMMLQYEYKSEPTKPLVFKDPHTGNSRLDPKYVYTSFGLTNHEDFTSYYPWLLIGMSAFHNDGLGYDRYKEMYEQKEINGKKMKDKEHYTDDERELFRIMREGNKLIINSASGAAGAPFENNIRMNNRILSMRMIGQMFSWRIGQAQAYEGARVPSTNTDGLYTIMEEKINAKILERESAATGVEIEPEPICLISKDTNNRLEFDPQTGQIISAAGGDLGCQKGPFPTKALAHAAIRDWTLCEYLLTVCYPNRYDARMDTLFDRGLAEKIIMSAKDKMDPVQWLKMMQTIVSSSPGSRRYVFGYKKDETDPIFLQHYNRAFFVKDSGPDTIHVKAASVKKITPATVTKRQKEGLRKQIHDPTALKVLSRQGITPKDIEESHEAAVSVIPGIAPELNLLIENRDLAYLPEDYARELMERIDYDAYLDRIEESFTRNWMVKTVNNQKQLKEASVNGQA